MKRGNFTRGYALLLIALCFSFAAFAQKGNVTGVVKDAKGQPMIGVMVLVKGTSTGTVTSKDGKYEISAPSNGTLEFRMMGFVNQEIAVNGKTEINVALNEDFKELDKVVVVGYGTQLKRDVTGAITSLNAEQLEQNSGADINSAIQGRVPGLEIVQTSGEPGAASNITIRGASSINGGTEPLYILDGVPLETTNIASIDGDASFSPLSALNPNDIESIEILKDAGSAAIYGSRAANGVVIITTKGGQKLGMSAPVFTIAHTSSLVQNSRNLDVLNGTQFREIYMEARTNQALRSSSSPKFDDWVSNPYNPAVYRSTDWQREMFKTVYQSRTDFNVRGSSNDFAYSLSVGYRDLKPTVVFTKYNQLNLKGNFTYKINKNIKAGTNYTFTRQNYRRVLTNNANLQSVIASIVKSNPCYNPYDPETGEIVYFIGKTTTDSGTRNPMALARDVPNIFTRDWTIINQYVEFSLLKNLSLRLQGSMETDASVQSMYTPRVFDNTTNIDKGAYQNNNTKRYLNENFFTYNFKSKDKRHVANAVLGMSLQKNTGTVIRLDGQDYVDSKIDYIQGAARYNNLSQKISESALMSYFTRATYSYRSKYMLSGTLRADGSSRFGSNNRFGYFPAASAGWRFSSENFMNFAKSWLQDAKLRASWGQTGNQSIGNYAWRGSYDVADTRYDGNSAILYDGMPNYNLGWETTTQTNIGLDLSLFKGRVAITADAYKKVSDDLLVNQSMPLYTGITSKPMNFGSIENKGLEFLVETINTTGALKWKTAFNFSLNRSKVLSLPTDNADAFLFGGVALAQVGQPVGVFYGYKALGIYASDADNKYTGSNAAALGVYHKGSAEGGDVFKGGDVIWDDLNGDGIIDDRDKQIIGDPNPKFIGGLSNNFSYKNWSLNLFFNFSYGGQIMNDFRRDRDAMTLSRNTGTDMLRRWKTQGDVTDRPRTEYGDYMGNFRQSSLWLEDASYLRLKEFTIAYRIKPKMKYIKEIKIMYTTNNLLTWSKYSGYDPEVNTSNNPFVRGVDAGAFPKSRTHNIGINLTF